MGPHLVGRADTVRDIDWVAVASERKDSLSCGYVGAGGGSVTGTSQRVSQTISVFERRTGRKLVEKLFTPKGGCVDSAYVAAGSTGFTGGDRRVTFDDVKPWLSATLQAL